MTSWISITFIPLVAIVILGVVFIVRTILKSKGNDSIPHPSELSSESRIALRPIRQSSEAFERALEQNKGSESAIIIGNQARNSVRKIVSEATRMVSNREVLTSLLRRTSAQSGDVTPIQDSINTIDSHLMSAVDAIDNLTLTITKSSIVDQNNLVNLDNDLPNLIERLKNVSQSFDEINQNIDQVN